MTAPLMLIDAASLWFRAYYALPDSLTAPDGTSVNAVRGFTDMIARLITDRRPQRLVLCLDADWRPAFRVAALPSYKTHRVAESVGNEEEVPDPLSPQIPIILDVMDAMGIAAAQAQGYEADDVIGTLSHQETAAPVEIVTGDRDLFQLVRDTPTTVRVVYLTKGISNATVFGPAEIAEKYAIPSENAGQCYADMAILRGDSSDGLPGVVGIGEKTAAKLITQFGSLAALLAAVHDPRDRILTAKVRTNLLAAQDYLAAAPTVVNVARNAPIHHYRADPVPSAPADLERLNALGRRWGITNSIKRLTIALDNNVHNS